VVTRFSKPFRGLEGRKLISDLRLFWRLDFLPPGKEFSQLVDSLPAYFRRREPTRLTVTIRSPTSGWSGPSLAAAPG
jgi:hypothetical protein